MGLKGTGQLLKSCSIWPMGKESLQLCVSTFLSSNASPCFSCFNPASNYHTLGLKQFNSHLTNLISWSLPSHHNYPVQGNQTKAFSIQTPPLIPIILTSLTNPEIFRSLCSAHMAPHSLLSMASTCPIHHQSSPLLHDCHCSWPFPWQAPSALGSLLLPSLDILFKVQPGFNAIPLATWLSIVFNIF